jgi:hypothetical protein
MIQFIIQINGDYDVETACGQRIGSVARDVDGKFYFWPLNNGSAWSGYFMRAIADKLDELNK